MCIKTYHLVIPVVILLRYCSLAVVTFFNVGTLLTLEVATPNEFTVAVFSEGDYLPTEASVATHHITILYGVGFSVTFPARSTQGAILIISFTVAGRALNVYKISASWSCVLTVTRNKNRSIVFLGYCYLRGLVVFLCEYFTDGVQRWSNYPTSLETAGSRYAMTVTLLSVVFCNRLCDTENKTIINECQNAELKMYSK